MLEDQEIIRRCKSGQTDLMDILIDRYQTRLYTLCRRLTRDPDDADDLFQDTWVNVVKNISRLQADHKFASWLFTVCVNRYRDRYRSRKSWLARIKEYTSGEVKEREMALQKSRDPGPDELVVRDEAEAAVRNAVDRLSDTVRIPIILHYFHDLGLREVAQALGIPEGTVKSRMARGREMLKKTLEGARHA